jgi:hypothetical protein
MRLITALEYGYLEKILEMFNSKGFLAPRDVYESGIDARVFELAKEEKLLIHCSLTDTLSLTTKKQTVTLSEYFTKD